MINKSWFDQSWENCDQYLSKDEQTLTLSFINLKILAQKVGLI